MLVSVLVFFLFRDRDPEGSPTMSTTTRTREPASGGDAPSRDTGSPARLRRILQYGVLGVLTLLFISPLLYMLSTAFKTTGDAASPDPQWIPAEPAPRTPSRRSSATTAHRSSGGS